MRSSNSLRLKKLLKAPLVKWPALVKDIPQLDCLEIARTMEGQIQVSVLLAEYLSLASTMEHEAARKVASKKLIKVRRALGYAYPKEGLAEVTW